jgi:hypothetical protein
MRPARRDAGIICSDRTLGVDSPRSEQKLATGAGCPLGGESDSALTSLREAGTLIARMPSTIMDRSHVALLLALCSICISVHSAHADLVDVRVVVSGEAAIDTAYVAFVPADHPLWRPAAEVIALSGVATVRVEPGIYRVIVGSRGFESETRLIQVPATRVLSVNVLPSTRINGFVQDEEGRPIKGARVSNIRASGPERLGESSDLARTYFAPDWFATTDANGWWALAADGRGKPGFVVEAPGFAPAFDFRGSSDADTSIKLQRGSTLHVDLDGNDGARFVTLRIHSPTVSGLTAEMWSRIWTRAATSSSIEWTSLPPGKYDVVAAYLDPRYFAHPVQIATVELSAAQRAEIHAALPPVSQIAPDPVVLFVRGFEQKSLTALHTYAMSPFGTSEEVDHAAEPVSAGILIYLRTTAAPDRVYGVTDTEAVLPKGENDRPAQSAREALVLKRSALVVRVRKAPDVTVDLPQWGHAHLGSCSSGATGNIAVRFDTAGEVNIPFASDCHSLVLQTPPFEALAIPVSVRAGERRTLGPYKLRLGATVNVRVIRDTSGEPVSKAVVRAVIPDSSRREDVVADAIADANGRAQLHGVPALRDLVVDAREPDSDLGVSVEARFEPGVTTSMDPLRVPAEAKIRIAPRLSASFRQRFPDAQTTLVTLDRREPGETSNRRTSPIDKGEALFEHLRPGHWTPTVLVDTGNGVHGVTTDVINVASGEHSKLEPEVDPKVFDGTITLRGKGVPGSIGFGEEPSPSAVTRFAHSAAGGRFTAILPKGGSYRVDFLADARPDLRIDAGDISLPEDGGRFSIELPQGEVTVTVHEGDQPAPNANVFATLRRTSTDGRIVEFRRASHTDSRGEARFEALLPGTWIIESTDVEHGKRSQKRADVSQTPVTVALNLNPADVLEGFVHDSRDEAVDGATVNCLFVADSRIPQTAGSDTDASGHFRIEFPDETSGPLHCGVTTMRGEISVVDTSFTTSADFVLPKETASLSFPDWGTHLSPNSFWLVADDGRMFDLTWAAAKLDRVWTRLNLSRFPAGSWSIVRVRTTEDWVALGLSGGNALSPLIDMTLKADDSRTVALYWDRDQ